jgi:hypothetical protein
MSNVKISALPQQVTTTILDIVPIVDSGNTLTSKITLSDLRGLTNGSGVNSLKSSTGLTATAAVASGANSIAIGSSISATTGYAFVFGGFSNTVSSFGSGIIGGSGQTITSTGINNVIVNGYGNDITQGNQHGMVGGRDNLISSPGESCGIFAAKTSTISSGSQMVVIGGHNHQITGSNEGGIFAGYQNTIQAGDDSTIYGGRGNLIQGGNKPSIINGGNNTITNSSATLKTIVGGSYNTISAAGIGTYDETDGLGIFNSRRSSVTGTTFFGTIVGSHQSFIGGAAVTDRFNAIFNSSGSTIINSEASSIFSSYNTSVSSKDFSVGIGLNSRALTFDNTTHVENAHAFGSYSTGTFSNPSGDTFTVNFENGGFQEIAMTGNTTVAFSGLRNGGNYRLRVSNASNYSITSTSASGYTILYEGGVIPTITSGGTDLCILEVFGTDLMIRHFAGFASV